jgi:acyl carrier protein
MPDIAETIKDIVIKIVHCDKEQLVPDTTWKELKADSLDIVQILIAAEDAFDIEIPDENVKGISDLGGFIDYIGQLVVKKSG